MTDHYSEYWTRDDFVESADAEIAALRAENERLRNDLRWVVYYGTAGRTGLFCAEIAIQSLAPSPPTDTPVFSTVRGA